MLETVAWVVMLLCSGAAIFFIVGVVMFMLDQDK